MRKLAVVFVLVAASGAIAWAVENRANKPVRALPPQWSKDVADVFFTDAREKLSGERPNFGASGARPLAPGPATTAPTGDAPAPAAGGFAWSKLVSSEVLEDEIKNQRLMVDQTVGAPGAFKGGGFREARIQFSTLAAMFAVIGEYDGQVRWKDDAPALRELFARAGFNCKVGTDQSYNEAKLRKQDLGDLVGGSRIDSLLPADPAVKWDQVANRPPLMSRMEEAHQKRLLPWLANEGEFKSNAEKVLHEAQILTLLAEVIQREGFEYWDDDTYLEYCQKLRDAAAEIVEAVKLNSYEKARAASGEATKACAECHDGYRS